MVIVAGGKGQFGKVPCWSVGCRAAAAMEARRDKVVGRMPVVVDLRIAVRRIRVAIRLSGRCRLLHRAAEASSHDAQSARELGVLPGCRQRVVRIVGQRQLEQWLEAILEFRVRCLQAAIVKCEWCQCCLFVEESKQLTAPAAAPPGSCCLGAQLAAHRKCVVEVQQQLSSKNPERGNHHRQSTDICRWCESCTCTFPGYYDRLLAGAIVTRLMEQYGEDWAWAVRRRR